VYDDESVRPERNRSRNRFYAILKPASIHASTRAFIRQRRPAEFYDDNPDVLAASFRSRHRRRHSRRVPVMNWRVCVINCHDAHRRRRIVVIVVVERIDDDAHD
jgi:hypothetical protein